METTLSDMLVKVSGKPMSAKLIEGFDYTERNPKQVKHTVKEWQQLMRDAEKDGGKRRVKDGETFVHDKKGYLVYECWGNVPV